jgi:hypothetical protein
LRQRRGDATVSPYFTELATVSGLSAGDLMPHVLELLTFCGGAPARRNQERTGVWLIHGDVLWSRRSAGEASALFAVGELVQDIQKEIASENAKREKYGG